MNSMAAQGGLKIEAEAVARELSRIADETPVRGRGPILAAAERLRHAAAAYPVSAPPLREGDVPHFRLSPQADEAAVALLQFAGIGSIPDNSYVLFSDDLGEAQAVGIEADIITLEREGAPVARFPAAASDSPAEARANLVAALARSLELSTFHLASAPEGKGDPIRERIRSLANHLFGGS